jgi:hypothetical protein
LKTMANSQLPTPNPHSQLPPSDFRIDRVYRGSSVWELGVGDWEFDRVRHSSSV